MQAHGSPRPKAASGASADPKSVAVARVRLRPLTDLRPPVTGRGVGRPGRAEGARLRVPLTLAGTELVVGPLLPHHPLPRAPA